MFKPTLEWLEGRELLSVYTVLNTNDSGSGSLREAITEANSDAGSTIDFDIPSSLFTNGKALIQPTTSLPDIIDSTTIDGYSQPGASPNTLAVGDNAVLPVTLDGSLAGDEVNGLRIDGGGATIQGLTILNFGGLRFNGTTTSAGILLFGSGDVIKGDFIGTDGVTGSGNGEGEGVVVYGSDDVIGGPDSVNRNVISGNVTMGVLINDTATRIVVSNDYVGTDAAGTAAVPNGQYGVDIQTSGNTVGDGNVISGNSIGGVIVAGTASNNLIVGNFIGTTADGVHPLGNFKGVEFSGGTANTLGMPGDGNVISGNKTDGVVFDSSNSMDNIVQANMIGTDLSGRVSIGNGGAGVDIDPGANTALNNQIGGPDPGDGNTIANNGVDGVVVIGATSQGISIDPNVIYGNESLGIDLGGGFYANSPTPRAGPNGLPNYPTFLSAVNSGGVVTLQGSLQSLPNTVFRLEFFANASVNTDGLAQGQQFLGFVNVTTDGNGFASYAVSFTTSVVGPYITATATDAAGNTSEFSPSTTLTTPMSPSPPGLPNPPTPPGSPPTPPGSSPPRTFVGALYTDLLGRPATPSEEAYWNGVADGVHFDLVVAGIEGSVERKTVEVVQIYHRYLRRDPDVGGEQFFVNFLLAGGTDQQVEDLVVGSPEYYALQGGTDDAWLNGVYQDGFGRGVDSNGYSYWSTELPVLGRAGVADALFSSIEYRSDFIAAEYEALLNREPDFAGLTFWYTSTTTQEQVITGIAASPEYQTL